MAPWKLPFLVAAIAVPIVAAFYVSPGLGLAAGAFVAVGIVAAAVRQRPREGIGRDPVDDRRRVLLVVSRPLEEGDSLEQVEVAVRGEGPGAADVRVLVPARIGFLDRWASDVEGARQEAQRKLVLTVASLARVGLAAEARVGDEDLVQAVEDQLQSYAATAVILITGAPEDDPAGEAAAAELERRLRLEFRRLAVSGPAAR